MRAAVEHQDSAKRMADAAAGLLACLDEDQQSRVRIDFADHQERTNWHYVPRERAGLSLKNMDDNQRAHTQKLLASGLSVSAVATAKTIIELEPILGALEGSTGRFARDSELYFVSIFGDTGADRWGWRFEGHHLSVNYTIIDNRWICATPLFFGANPAEVRHGEREGLRALAVEEDLARELLFDLDGEQRRQAIVNTEAPTDILTRNSAYVRDEVEPEGLSAVDMNQSQRNGLRRLVEVYVQRLPEPLATAEMANLESTDLTATHFAWAGAAERGAAHYYRVQGAVFLAEYDNTQNDANHIHAVWRNLLNDFGEDLLKDHYQQSHR